MSATTQAPQQPSVTQKLNGKYIVCDVLKQYLKDHEDTFGTDIKINYNDDTYVLSGLTKLLTTEDEKAVAKLSFPMYNEPQAWE